MKSHHKKLRRKCYLVITCFMLIITLTAYRNADFVDISYKIGNSIAILKLLWKKTTIGYRPFPFFVFHKLHDRYESSTKCNKKHLR